ncbi:hypothetical protein JCGZ_01196 [Jatropha curcas]|uniref:Cation/H+ exchanger transmembrane domain-containing protein n=1 Tax=Jatropha curcas TaxID=180498 RepID=A0A067L8B5_JATCU|nr:hypothetical protein JCGZ_01196 [Jatropha curcas]
MYENTGEIRVKHGTETIIYPTVCIDYQEETQHYGFFFKANNPLDFIFPTLFVLLRPLKQPKFVSYILSGIILGPSVLGRNKTYMETIFPAKEMGVLNTFALFSSVLYVFIMAIKIDTTMLLKTANAAWTIGLSTYIVPFGMILFFHSLIKDQVSGCVGEIPPLILSSALSNTFFSVIAHVMEQLNLLTTELGQLALACGVIMESVGHILLLTMTILTTKDGFSSILSVVLAYAPVFITLYILRPLMLVIIKRTPPGKPVKEKYVMLVFILLFVMVLIANSVWGFFLPMAFLMGLIIPEGPPLGSAIVEKLGLILKQLFLPLFFVQIGFLTDVSSIKNVKAAGIFILLIGCNYLLKFLVALFVSLYFNIRFKNAILLGIILNFKGIMDLIVYKGWKITLNFGTDCFTVMVLLNVTFIAFFSPLIHYFYDPKVRLFQSDSSMKFLRTLHSIPQDVELRILTCIHNEDNVHGIINLLEASSCKSSNSSTCAYVVNVDDIVGRTAPLLTRYTSHKMRLKDNNSDHHIFRAFRNYSKNSNGFVSIIPFTMVAPYKGPDDREALALATRMSSNPDVKITLLRINSEETNYIATIGKQLDDQQVKEFREKNAHNARVAYGDVAARTSIEMVDVIRSLDSVYDLVMVGRNPTNMQFEKEMMEWAEYPELGVIADMFATTLEDFCDSKMSVLTLQHCRLVSRY